MVALSATDFATTSSRAFPVPHVTNRMQVAGIDNELHARAGPVTEHVGKAVAGCPHENAGLEVLMADRAVLDGVVHRGLELRDLLVEGLLAKFTREVMANGDVALRPGWRGRQQHGS